MPNDVTSARRILIADDHAIVRFGVSMIVREEMPNAIIADTDNFNKALDLLDKEPFHLLILDINLPGGNNIQMLDKVRRNHPRIKILMFTAYSEETFAIRYVQAGADGFIAKDSPDDEIRVAIRTVLNNQQYLSKSVKESLFNSVLNKESTVNPLSLLSNREADVMRLFLQGNSIAEVAAILHIHSTTVSTYKTRIFEKLNVRNLVDLVEKYRMLSNSN